MPGSNSIDGLASNLDTTSIVDAIIQSERFNVDHLISRQTEATNQITTYNSISALTVALSTAVKPLQRESSFMSTTVSVSDETKIGAMASGTVTAGTYTLSVNSLARNHLIASQGFDDPAVDSLGIGSVQITVGSGSAQTIMLDASNNTLTGLKNAINEARVGVTASIVSDGTSSKAYRIILNSDGTGTGNTISVVTTLTGGTAPDFTTSSFDLVETLGTPTGTSVGTLGATAAYTGSENKTYTFTVGGTGSQTVGAGSITIDWTDGTNSGSFTVDAADTEVALTGTGSDGLKLSFAAGTLVAGEKIQVQTFSPLLQAARDASISLGSSDGGGSPIVVTSSSNQIKDLIGGLTLDLKEVTTEPITITTAVDRDGIKSKITNLLDKYNEVMRSIDRQFSYDSDTGEAGLLLGDQFLMTLQTTLRSKLTGTIGGLPRSMNMLRAIGIQTAGNGLMTLVDTSALNGKLDTDLAGVIKLFTDSGSSSHSLISFIAAGNDSVENAEGYEIDITQAATRMSLQGASITDPAVTPLTLTSSNNKLKLTIDGVLSEEITLTAKQYNSGTELAAELQEKINSDAVIGERGVKVEWVDNGGDGYLKFTSGSYGSDSKVVLDTASSTALNDLGLANGTTETAGKDVAGTINGEEAAGKGRLLTGAKDNTNTAGIILEVRMSQSDVVAGTDATVTFSRGFAARLDRAVDTISRSNDGQIARRTKGIQAQIDDLAVQIADQEERLAVRREKLFARFIAMESALSQFNIQGQFLEQQLSQLSANTSQITKR